MAGEFKKEGDNVAYLTFSEYTELGGTIATESVFTNLERDAEYELNDLTQNRLKTATVIIDDVKYVMTKFVNLLNEKPSTVMGGYGSYSNGIESMSSSKSPNELIQNELQNIAIKYLPIELISSYIESASEV